MSDDNGEYQKNIYGKYFCYKTCYRVVTKFWFDNCDDSRFTFKQCWSKERAKKQKMRCEELNKRKGRNQKVWIEEHIGYYEPSIPAGLPDRKALKLYEEWLQELREKADKVLKRKNK